jgi:hypothetical protein
MASKVILSDDIDETTDGVHTVTFAHEGVSYEIDLSPENREKLEQALAPFKSNGRRANSSSKPRPRGGKEDLNAIREWAKKNGYSVADRGRVAENIRQAYYSAN